MDLKALCMKCRVDGKPTMQTMTNPKVEAKQTDRGIKYSAKGICAQCGGNMFKFMNEETAKQVDPNVRVAA